MRDRARHLAATSSCVCCDRREQDCTWHDRTTADKITAVKPAGDAWCDVLDKERFNAGILSLQPGMPDFVEMIADYRNDTLYKWEGQAEQGLLNWCADASLARPVMAPDMRFLHWVVCSASCEGFGIVTRISGPR